MNMIHLTIADKKYWNRMSEVIALIEAFVGSCGRRLRGSLGGERLVTEPSCRCRQSHGFRPTATTTNSPTTIDYQLFDDHE